MSRVTFSRTPYQKSSTTSSVAFSLEELLSKITLWLIETHHKTRCLTSCFNHQVHIQLNRCSMILFKVLNTYLTLIVVQSKTILETSKISRILLLTLHPWALLTKWSNVNLSNSMTCKRIVNLQMISWRWKTLKMKKNPSINRSININLQINICIWHSNIPHCNPTLSLQIPLVIW